MSDLKSRMIEAACRWCAAHDAPLSRIGKQVAGDAAFFARMDRADATCTVTTLERFAAFLADGANWPDGRVPQDVVDFGHVVGISAADAAASPGKVDGVSPLPRADGLEDAA